MVVMPKRKFFLFLSIFFIFFLNSFSSVEFFSVGPQTRAKANMTQFDVCGRLPVFVSLLSLKKPFHGLLFNLFAFIDEYSSENEYVVDY